MDTSQILSHIDHTLLKATADWADIRKLCDEAVAWKTASVCIPPAFVPRVKAAYGDNLVICTVIGFPLGYNSAEVKAFEAAKAISEGAAEVDMVVNLGDVKAGSFDKITAEIAMVKKAAGDHILKVIVETCYLTDEEKITMCKCITEGGADYIKTSTGFGTGGASFDDVLLFKKHIGPSVKIKASGGIRSQEDMEAFIRAGCDRLGTSSAAVLLRD